MKYPNKEKLEIMRKRYPAGTRIELMSMNDSQAPPKGTKGTIEGIDDIGSILVSWDNGSNLNLIYEIDKFKVVS
jgi:hypothetical protein